MANDDEDPDADILRRFDRGKRGDRDRAITLLMQRHGNAVYRYCCKGLRDPTLADDVHQQVFLCATTGLATFQRHSTLRVWLFGIARHRVLDAGKTRGRLRTRFDEGDDTVDTVDPRPSAADALEALELQAALSEALDELEDHVRAAVLLRYQQGFTYEQMAQICGEKATTLHARVTRALPVLRRHIERRLRLTSTTTPPSAPGATLRRDDDPPREALLVTRAGKVRSVA
jgi:RNA polymerase sigma-70 factor (ECF subfamily)